MGGVRTGRPEGQLHRATVYRARAQYLIAGDQEVAHTDGFGKGIALYFDGYVAMSHGALCRPILVAFVLGGENRI